MLRHSFYWASLTSRLSLSISLDIITLSSHTAYIRYVLFQALPVCLRKFCIIKTLIILQLDFDILLRLKFIFLSK